jgi:hypothetical protein
MAQLVQGALTTVDSSKKVMTGTRVKIADATTGIENEYIYLKGVANTAAGSVVAIDFDGTDFITALVADTNCGQPLAVALAATSADTYGWYQIFGLAEAAFLIDAAADAAIFTSNTDGSLDDTASGHLQVMGIHLIDTLVAAGNGTCVIMYPHAAAVAES